MSLAILLHGSRNAAEPPALLGQSIFNAGRPFSEYCALSQAAILQSFQALGKGSRAYSGERMFKIAEALRSRKKVADDQKHSGIADQIGHLRDGTGLCVSAPYGHVCSLAWRLILYK